MKELLLSHPELLERFVLENVSLDTLESWLDQKSSGRGARPAPRTALAGWKVCDRLQWMPC